MVDRATGIESSLDDVKEKALEFAATAREQFAGGTHLLREYIVKEPTRALGIALGMGVVLGWLIKRR
jgi:ElaB/YqjD/DUF883 family membrane-anchored ribosome-binding protein